MRRALPQDVPEIVRLKAVLMQTGWPFDVELDADWWRRAEEVAHALVRHPDHGWFVVDAAELQDGAAGLAACASVSLSRHLPGPRGTGISAYLGDMCTEPRLQGRGLGALLVQECLSWARGAGAGRAELYSTPAGRRLYERFGFAPAADGPFEFMTLAL